MTDDRLRAIRERLARVPKLHATTAAKLDDNGDGTLHPAWREESDWGGAEDAVWTLSDDDDKIGWHNDSDCGGYGLPKQVAEDIAALRDDVAWLLQELERRR